MLKKIYLELSLIRKELQAIRKALESTQEKRFQVLRGTGKIADSAVSAKSNALTSESY